MQQLHQSDGQAHRNQRGDQPQQQRLGHHGTVQLPLPGADGAQQRQRAAALRHQHLEGVGDDECRHEHGKHAEDHHERGHHAGLPAAQPFEHLVLARAAVQRGEVRGQQGVDLLDDLFGVRARRRLDVQVQDRAVQRCVAGIDGHAVHQPSDRPLGHDGRAAVVRVRAARIQAQAADGQLDGRAIRVGRADRIPDADVEPRRHIPREYDLPVAGRPLTLRQIDRHQRGRRGVRDDDAAGVPVAGGHLDVQRHVGAHAGHALDPAHLVQVQVADGDAVHRRVVVAGHDRVIRVPVGRRDLPAQRVVERVAEQQRAGDEHRADQDGDARRDQHPGVLSHEFERYRPHERSSLTSVMP